MMNFFKSRDNSIETALQFIRSLDVDISYQTLKREIEEHPFFPSLLSISEVLNSYGVKNVAAKFNVNDIINLPMPYLVQVRDTENGNYFSVVREKVGDFLEYFDPVDSKWKQRHAQSFADKCTGVVLLAEVVDTADGLDNRGNVVNQEKSSYIPVLGVVVLPVFLATQTIFSFIYEDNIGVMPFIFSIVFLLGASLSFLLLLQEVDFKSPFAKMTCSSKGKIDCNAVLNSDGSRIFGVHWSVIGISYFLGGLIYLQSSGYDSLVPFVAIWQINLLGSLFTFYSVYYQLRVVRKWCTLCLLVQGVLIIASIIGIVAGWYKFSELPFNNYFHALPVFVISFIVASILSSLLRKLKIAHDGEVGLQRFKRNPEVIASVLSDQKVLTIDATSLGIMLGNSASNNRIIKVCNPYCSPCSIIHDSINNLLRYNENLSVQIIFTPSRDDPAANPVRHFLALYESRKDTILDVLNDWYHSNEKNYDDFSTKFPVDEQVLLQQDGKIDAMREWCKSVDVAFTPTFFVNGYQLPSIFKIDDLKYYFLE